MRRRGAFLPGGSWRPGVDFWQPIGLIGGREAPPCRFITRTLWKRDNEIFISKGNARGRNPMRPTFDMRGAWRPKAGKRPLDGRVRHRGEGGYLRLSVALRLAKYFMQLLVWVIYSLPLQSPSDTACLIPTFIALSTGQLHSRFIAMLRQHHVQS